MEKDLELKQQQFNLAMERYEEKRQYKLLGKAVSIINVSLQILLLFRVSTLSIGWVGQIVAFVSAMLVTDYLNGLVHLYMDNNDNYNSWAGPLIANFHLHHRTPRYQDRNIFVVYFVETGSKVWLVFYLSAILYLSSFFQLKPVMFYTLVYIGILSSVAEVSHYLCHNSQSTIVNFLARSKLLLSKQQHAHHHREDNCNYTFLNGVTDPLVNAIAKKYYAGYKNGTDLHYSQYKPKQ